MNAIINFIIGAAETDAKFDKDKVILLVKEALVVLVVATELLKTVLSALQSK